METLGGDASAEGFGSGGRGERACQQLAHWSARVEGDFTGSGRRSS